MRKGVNGRIKSIDGIRGIGAFIIAFIWHYQHFTPIHLTSFPRFLQECYNYSWLFVEMFFMVSGYLIHSLYYSKIKERITLKEFYFNRLSKLYPLMFMSLIVVTIEQAVLQLNNQELFVYSHFDAYHFLLNLLGIQTGALETQYSFNGPMWFVSVLLFCYIGYYIMVKIESKFSIPIVYECIFLIYLGLSILICQVSVPFFNNSMARGIACFSVGILINLMENKLEEKQKSKIGNIFGIILLGLIILIVFSKQGIAILGDIRIFFILCIAPMILWCACYQKMLRGLLSSRAFTELGKISYSIFVWHFPVQCLIHIIDVVCGVQIDYYSIRFYGGYVVSVLVISYLSYHFVERRINLKDIVNRYYGGIRSEIVQ